MNFGGSITEWLIILLTVVNGGLTVSSWYIRKMLVSKEEHAALVKRVDALEKDATVAPGWGKFNSITESVAKLDASIQVMGAKIEALKDSEERTRGTVELLQQHILDAEKR